MSDTDMDYEITGMRCASCAARVENALRKVAGDQVTVNFATKLARVPGEASPASLHKAVRELGYDLTPVAPLAPPLDGGGRLSPAALAKREAILAAILTVPVFTLGMLHVATAWSGVVQFVLTLAIFFGPGRAIFMRALRLALRLTSSMDTLVAIGAGTAFAASAVALGQGRFDFYFETAAVIVTFVLLGRWLEERARGESLAAIDALKGMQIKTAVRLTGEGGEETVAVDALRPGELFMVRPGEKAACDGKVVKGRSSMDESFMTGEAAPAPKKAGDIIYGATTNNGSTPLVVEATHAVGDSALARIVQLVDAAQMEKSRLQRLADNVAGAFVPFILLAAFATLSSYVILLETSWREALLPTIAVLVIACPCALGLAIPTALVVATGRGALARILIRSARGFERLGSAKIFVFDKTGTLTEGRPRVVAAHVEAGVDESLVLGAAAAAEKSSLHPLAMALVAYAEERGLSLPVIADSHEVAGSGVEATLADRAGGGRRMSCLVGKLEFLKARGVAIPPSWEQLATAEDSSVLIALDGRAAAAFTIKDELREDAAQAVAALRKLRVEVVLATGDRAAVAEPIASLTGITQVHAGLTPEGKTALIENLGRDQACVAMIGDGINDAPALAKADVGLAVGRAADLAIDAAAVVIPHGDLTKVVSAVRLARATLRIMRQNLAWAFIYNIAMIPLAAGGHLTPMMAAGAMALSSVSVVLNSLRLKHFPKHL